MKMGGTTRLGSFPCRTEPQTRVFEAARMRFSGLSPDEQLVEMIELHDHPWFVATQARPEFKSRPVAPHPLFSAFVEAAVRRRIASET